MRTPWLKKTDLQLHLGVLCCLAIALSGCTPARVLDQAKAQWQAQEVTQYRIQVRHVNSVWHAQTYDIEVDNGEITHSAVCTPAPTEMGVCEVIEYDPADYTVEGLFDFAESVIGTQNTEHVKLEFDEEYGYPRVIAFNDPDILDEDFAVTVVSFEALETGF